MRGQKNLSILTYVFLCFFLFYAVSPLTYSLAGNQPQQTLDAPNKTSKTIRLFIIDVLFSSLSQQNNDNADNPAEDNSHILLRKKRALRSSNSGIVAEPVAHLAKHFEIPKVREQAFLTSADFSKKIACPGGFQLFHSGISPPSV